MILSGNYHPNVLRSSCIACLIAMALSTETAAQFLKMDKRDGKLKVELKSDWLPSDDQVSHVESLLKIPPKIGRLQNYNRYWMGKSEGGHKYIDGYLNMPTNFVWNSSHTEILRSATADPKAQIVKYALVGFWFDPGCGELNIRYDVGQDRILSHRCSAGLGPGSSIPSGWRPAFSPSPSKRR